MILVAWQAHPDYPLVVAAALKALPDESRLFRLLRDDFRRTDLAAGRRGGRAAPFPARTA